MALTEMESNHEQRRSVGLKGGGRSLKALSRSHLKLLWKMKKAVDLNNR